MSFRDQEGLPRDQAWLDERYDQIPFLRTIVPGINVADNRVLPSERCRDCSFHILQWNNPDQYTGQCPSCSHYHDETIIKGIEDQNKGRECECGCGSRFTTRVRICVCPCKCEFGQQDDADKDDADYRPSFELQDNINVELLEPTAPFEERLARSYGWQTNVSCTMHDQEERRVFFEAPGHCAVATLHDIGRPAESSMANSENTIGKCEAQFLLQGLEPWEVETIQKATSLSYDQIKAKFPEARHLQLPRSSQRVATDEENLILVCEHCNHPRSQEFLEWLREGNMSMCRFCNMARRPLIRAKDPDWHISSPSVTEILTTCLCRCDCDLQELQTMLHEDPDDFADLIGEDVEMVSDDGNDTNAGPATAPQTRPHNGASPEDDSTSESSGYDPAFGRLGDYSEAQEEILDMFELEDMRFSQNPVREEAVMEDIQTALRHADDFMSWEMFEEAHGFARLALYFCRLHRLPLDNLPHATARTMVRELGELLGDLDSDMSEDE